MLCIGPGDDGAWGYQSCTENLHQFGARGPIRDYTFAVASIASICAKVFNGTSVLDSTALATRYGGYKLADVPGVVSNVIWSNGVLLHCHCICLFYLCLLHHTQPQQLPPQYPPSKFPLNRACGTASARAHAH